MSPKSPAPCRCGHPYTAHEHLRPGTECVTCPVGGCGRYRPVRWWYRFVPLPGGGPVGDARPGDVGPAVDHQPGPPVVDPDVLGVVMPAEVRDRLASFPRVAIDPGRLARLGRRPDRECGAVAIQRDHAAESVVDAGVRRLQIGGLGTIGLCQGIEYQLQR